MRIFFILLLSFFIYETGTAQDAVMFVSRGKIIIIDSLKLNIISPSYPNISGTTRTDIRMIVQLDTSIFCSNRVVLNYDIKYDEKTPFVEGKRYKFVIEQKKVRDFDKRFLARTVLSHCHFIISYTDPAYFITSFEEE